MIYYNSNAINDWNFGEDNIIKVYRNNAVCYYKVTSGDTPTPVQEPCFAVVDNISQYSETEFEDVFNLADEKWYKLNNLNQYEEYGIYGSGRTITTYEGKLTIDEEASPSRLPQGYTEVEYIENTSTAYINTEVLLYDSTTNSYNIQCKCYFQPYGNDFEYLFGTERTSSPYVGVIFRYYQRNIQYAEYPENVSWTHIDNGDGTSGITASCSSTTATNGNNPLTLFCGLWSTGPWRNGRGKIYSFKVTKNDTLVRDLVPCKRDSDNKYGMYDIVNDVFYLSPNNVDFSGGEPVIQPTKTYEYIYSGGSWVNLGEVSGSTATLPDVPFTLNYNAKNYDASTHTIPYTEGALNAIDAVITGTTANIIDHSSDGYIELTGSSSTAIRALVGTTNFSRSSSSPNITIICKAYTPGSSTEGNILSNRNESYNWMYRHKSSILTFHGNSEQGSIAVSNTEPNTCSVRIDSSRLLTYNNWTQNTTSTQTNFSYGSNSNGGALFSGYYSRTGEYWKGVFYWIYMSLNTLTDEQVQQVIAYNEGGGGQTEYPLEYVVREDPPNNLSFSSMEEAEEYECPWVGMHATIAGDNYVFSGDSQSGYEWVYKPSRLPQGYTEVEYVENTGTSYFNTNFVPNQDTRVVCDMQLVTASNFPRLWGAGTWNSATGIQPNYEEGYLRMSWFGNTSWTSYTSVPISFDRKVYDVNKNYLYVDSVQIGSNTYTTRTASDPIGVFTYIASGRPSSSRYWGQEHFKGKMYSFKVYDNGTLVRDLVPCVRDNDNEVGAYDIVNDVFYTVPTGYTTDKLKVGWII